MPVRHLFLEIMAQHGIRGGHLRGELALVALRISAEDVFQFRDRILVDFDFSAARKVPDRVGQPIQVSRGSARIEAFDYQRIGLEALNGFLEDLTGDPNSPARRFGGNDSYAPVQQFGSAEGGKTDVS